MSSSQSPESSSRRRVSVVILAYNSEEFLPGCFESLRRSQGIELEMICVDNASRDKSHEIASNQPDVIAVRSEENLGCAGGNNLGWRKATAPLVIFINPDCRVMPNALEKLTEPLVTDPEAGLTGALLLYPNTNKIQHAGGILHPNAMTNHFGEGEEDAAKWHETKEVDYVTGALVAVRREDLEAIGGFDPEYWPAYFEETDLCLRIKALGKRILYVGEAVAYHWESPALQRESPRFLRTLFRARMIFVVKNYSLGRFVKGFLPFEVKWLASPHARGLRWAVLRSYFSGLLFALKCLFRFRRRPSGIR